MDKCCPTGSLVNRSLLQRTKEILREYTDEFRRIRNNMQHLRRNIQQAELFGGLNRGGAAAGGQSDTDQVRSSGELELNRCDVYIHIYNM